jgi:hypothetical protein
MFLNMVNVMDQVGLLIELALQVALAHTKLNITTSADVYTRNRLNNNAA